MYKPMRFHSSCYTNTQRTFTTNTRLITTSCWVKCMSNYHFGWISSDKHISLRKSTNITARCKSMWFELVKTSKLVGTVSTLLQLCSSVNTNTELQFTVTLRTIILSSISLNMKVKLHFGFTSVAVHTTSSSPKFPGLHETFVKHMTFAWFPCHVICLPCGLSCDSLDLQID